MGRASGLLIWVRGPHKPQGASVGGPLSLQPLWGCGRRPDRKETGPASHRPAFGGPTSSVRPQSARSCLGLFRELGPCRCKQRPGIERPLGLASAVVGLRCVRCRRPRRTGCTPSNPALIGGTSASVRCQSRRSSTLARDGCHRRPTNARLQSSSPRSTICRMVTLIFLPSSPVCACGGLPQPRSSRMLAACTQAGCWRPARARRPYVCCYCFACQCFTGWAPLVLAPKRIQRHRSGRTCCPRKRLSSSKFICFRQGFTRLHSASLSPVEAGFTALPTLSGEQAAT